MLQESIGRFKELLNGSQEQLYTACVEFVNALDHEEPGEDVRSEFSTRCNLSFGTLALFEKVGRNQMDVRLLLFKGRAANQLRKMPLSTQRKVLDRKMLEVYDPNGAGDSYMMVSYDELNKEQWKMVFTNEYIRDIPGQKNYWNQHIARIDSGIEQYESLQRGSRYQIAQGKLYVRRDTHFTKNQVREIFCRMNGVNRLSDLPADVLNAVE